MSKLRPGLPWWLSGKEPICQCRRHCFDLWVGTIPWRRKWQPTPVFLPGESHGQRSLAGYSAGGHRRARHNWATKQQQQQNRGPRSCKRLTPKPVLNQNFKKCQLSHIRNFIFLSLLHQIVISNTYLKYICIILTVNMGKYHNFRYSYKKLKMLSVQ